MSIVYVVIYQCLRAKTAQPLLPSMQKARGAFLGSAQAAILPLRTEACLRGSEARDGYAEGAAAHVVEPDALEKRDARGVSAVLPADAQLQLCADTPPAGYEVVPTEQGLALMEYLHSLKIDYELPEAKFAPAATPAQP